jgi:CHAT domain-containing protein
VAGFSEARSIQPDQRCFHFDSLVGVETEMASVRQVLQNRVEELGRKVDRKPQGDLFTKERFQNLVESSTRPVIHLATHGNFSSNPQDTFILTAPDQSKQSETYAQSPEKRDPDLLYLSDLQDILQTRRSKREHPVELLVLSACKTAEGDNRATLGMAGVAVRSGASSTLASLWSVGDQSTAALMKHFYQAWLQQLDTPTGSSKAEALRQAQLHLLAFGEDNLQFREPKAWAAFVLIGNSL